MAMVGPPSWQDMLADETHELETRARLDDPLALDQARNMLRVLRSYEVCVRQIALSPDPYDDPLSSIARSLPKRWR